MNSRCDEQSFVRRSWTSSDGLDLAARDYAGGAGEARLPVICLHGLTRNARDFEAVAPAISARGRRVVVPDTRGRGASAYDPDPLRYQVGTYAQDVAELCAALGIGRAVFVGTSMGGLVTLELARSAPHLVAAAALNDIGPEFDASGLARIAAYAGGDPHVENWADAVDYTRVINAAAFPAYDARDWERFARRLFRDPDAGEPPRLDYDPAIATALRAAGGPPPDLWSLFETLAADRPLLLIRGARSDLLSVATRDAMRRRAPAMRSVEVEGVGHAPTLEEPAARTALAAFLDDAP